jgi:hypothetical protein
VIRRFRKVDCRLDDAVLVLLDVLPELLAVVADKVLGCCTAAGIVGAKP